MNDILDKLDRTPCTYVILLAYLTLAFLTDPFNPTTPQLLQYGATVGLLVQDGEWWRLLSGAFLHGNLLHLAFNSYCLIVVGPQLEMSLGSKRFCLLYAVAALAGSANAVLFSHTMGSVVGGSGALFGMFGATLAMHMRSGKALWDFMRFAGPRSLVSLIVLNLVLGLIIPGISNAGHLGGLLGGFILMFCFLDRGRHDQPDWISRTTQAGWIALLAGLTLHALYPASNESLQSLRLQSRYHTPEAWTVMIRQSNVPDEFSDALRRLRSR